MTDRSSARAAKENLRTVLRPLPGVGGIGIGRRDGGYVVTVDVAHEHDSAQVPGTWDGVPVEVRVVGRVVPLPVDVPAAGPRTDGGPLPWGPAREAEGTAG